MKKSTKFLLAILVIQIFLLVVWLWAGELKENKSLNGDIESLNTQIIDLTNNNAELLADAQKETERANVAESERDIIKKRIEKLQKQAPEPLKIPKICLSAATVPVDIDAKGVITYLCREIGLRNDSERFYINLSLEYEKAIRAGDETIKNLKSANNNYIQAVANFRNLEELQQKKFDMLLKKERKKKYKWGLGGVLLGAVIGFAIK